MRIQIKGTRSHMVRGHCHQMVGYFQARVAHVSIDPSLTDSDASSGFRALPVICPDNCLAEIIGAINESEETLYISAQYLDEIGTGVLAIRIPC